MSAVDTATVRVLIVEDHPMVAAGFTRVLDAEPGITVVGTVALARDVLGAVADHDPTVVVADQTLPDGRGTEVARKVLAEHPGMAVLILSAGWDEAVAIDALEAGCRGYLCKTRPPEDLARAVRAAAAGEVFMPYEAMTSLLRRQDARRWSVGADLTPREVEVLAHLARGLGNVAVAEVLGLSRNTVNNHIQNALYKLGVHSKLEAVVLCIREGIVPPPRADDHDAAVPAGPAGA